MRSEMDTMKNSLHEAMEAVAWLQRRVCVLECVLQRSGNVAKGVGDLVTKIQSASRGWRLRRRLGDWLKAAVRRRVADAAIMATAAAKEAAAEAKKVAEEEAFLAAVRDQSYMEQRVALEKQAGQRRLEAVVALRVAGWQAENAHRMECMHRQRLVERFMMTIQPVSCSREMRTNMNSEFHELVEEMDQDTMLEEMDGSEIEQWWQGGMKDDDDLDEW
jgi:hypothetical protein